MSCFKTEPENEPKGYLLFPRGQTINRMYLVTQESFTREEARLALFRQMIAQRFARRRHIKMQTPFAVRLRPHRKTQHVYWVDPRKLPRRSARKAFINRGFSSQDGVEIFQVYATRQARCGFAVRRMGDGFRSVSDHRGTA